MANVFERMKKKNNKPVNHQEWSRTGSFLYKPDRGWIHPDGQLVGDEGVCYGVRFIGCIEIKESMKSLDFDTRTAVTREAINVVAEAAGLKTATKKRKVDKKITKMLADLPIMHHAGANVNLTISTDTISLIVMESGDMIAEHLMHNVSFASGGDAESLDFVAYVGKDAVNKRTCQVLECGGGLAEDVVTTIGQAFELRFKQFLQKQPKAVELNDRTVNEGFEREDWGEDKEYYNDHPGAMPPSPNRRPPVPPIPQYSSPSSFPVNQYDSVKSKHLNGDYSDITEELIVDLSPTDKVYDNSEGAVGGVADFENSVYDNRNGSTADQSAVGGDEFVYDNKNGLTAEQNKDVFDMTPFNGDIPSDEDKETKRESVWPDSGISAPLFEEWFHGNLGRKDAEKLLRVNGDFLVRESSNKSGQFVLSGKQDGVVRHLLLVDPEGVVRTKDFIFDSVGHLVQYHRQNNLPIVTQGSELLLQRPVKTCISAC